MDKYRWYYFYRDRIENKSYEEYFNKKYQVFLEYLSKNIKEDYKVLEVGCGTSLVTKSLYRNNINFKVIDNNSKMLELTSINLKGLSVTKELCDIRKLLKEDFDIIYSHGVLEHFNLDDIRLIIKRQLRSSKFLVHYVPSSKYKIPSFGDELLISKEKWEYELGPSKIIEFNRGYDLILIWDRRITGE